MRSGMRPVGSFFAKATVFFLTPQQRTNRITSCFKYACMIWILKKSGRKIYEQNLWKKPPLCSYILDVTCMVRIVHFPSRCWPCRLTTFEADATTDVAEDASAQVADTATVSSCLDQFVYPPWKVWWKISWLVNSFQHFARVIMLQF